MKKVIILLIFICLLMLSACFPTGKQKKPANFPDVNQSIQSTTTFVDVELDKNLLIQADVSIPDHQQFKVATMTLKNFDQQKIKTTLLQNKSITETYENPNDLFPEINDTHYVLNDELYVRTEIGGVWYADNFYNEREYDNVISGATYFVRSDLHDVYTQTSLSNLDKNHAIEIVRNTLQDLGIRELGEPEVIALDVETLDSEWEAYETKHGNLPRKWEKEDEAYVIIFPIMYDDVAITNKGYFNPENQLPVVGSRVMGVVNKDGLIYFTCNGIYEIDNGRNEEITTISLETALEKVKDKYKDILLTEPITISHISLEYVPTVSNNDGISYELIPAWIFTGKEEITFSNHEGESKGFSEFTIMIDAETGQEVRNGGPY